MSTTAQVPHFDPFLISQAAQIEREQRINKAGADPADVYEASTSLLTKLGDAVTAFGYNLLGAESPVEQSIRVAQDQRAVVIAGGSSVAVGQVAAEEGAVNAANTAGSTLGKIQQAIAAVTNFTAPSVDPNTVRYGLIIGAVVLLLFVVWSD